MPLVDGQMFKGHLKLAMKTWMGAAYQVKKRRNGHGVKQRERGIANVPKRIKP
jgi:hypothetical protein